MRPTITEMCEDLYECSGCGKRTRESGSRRCEACGSELINLGRSRDL